MALQFEDFDLDLDRRVLSRRGTELPGEPRVFDVLAHLATHAERMVSKQELLDGLWGDQFVSESTLATAIKQARRILQDSGQEQRIIRPVPGRDYRMVAEVRQSEAAGASPPTASAAVLGGDPVASAAPRDTGDLVGRDKAMQRLLGYAAPGAVVTLVGTGGVGKTSLAVAASARMLASHPGGVRFCDLTRATPEQVSSVVLGAIDGSAGTAEATVALIAQRLGDRPAALILDNCEHVLDAARDLAEGLRDAAPALTIVATSRQALDCLGEKVVRLQGLRRDGPDSPAVELFMRRAGEVAELDDQPEERAVAEHMHQLVEQSVLTRVATDVDTRFRLLEPIRPFVADRLDEGERAALAERHARSVARRTKALAPALLTPEEPVAARRLTDEWPDLTRAVAWGLEHGDGTVAVEPLVAIGYHLRLQGRSEAYPPLERGVRECELDDDQRRRAQLLVALGVLTSGDVPRARALVRGATGDQPTTASGAFVGTYVALYGGEDVERRLEQCTWPSGVSWLRLAQLSVAARRGEGERSRSLAEEVGRRSDECSAPFFQQLADTLGAGLRQRDDPEQHLARAARAVRLVVSVADEVNYPFTFRSAVAALPAAGRDEVAAQVVGFVQHLDARFVPAGEASRDVVRALTAEHDDAVERVVERLGRDTFERIRVRGRRLSPQEAADLISGAETGGRPAGPHATTGEKT